MKKVTFIAIFFLMFNLFAQNEFNLEESVKEEKLAAASYLEKDFQSFLTHQEKALMLRPLHPRIMYNLAAAYALNDQKEDAFLLLDKIAGMGLFFPAKKDSDFVSIWKDEKFKNISKKFEKNLAHYGNSKIVFSYPDKNLITESIAYDSLDKKFYLGSVNKRKILSIDGKGNKDIFKNNGEDNLYAVFGMKADSKRRTLWVCSGVIEQMDNFEKNENGKSAVFKYDLDSKRLLKKYELNNKNEEHLFGDLTLNSNGDVFISDSKFNAIYKISDKKDELEIFIEPGKFYSLQGIDLSKNGEYLFAADYPQGLFKINLKTKEIEKIKTPDNFTPLGIDGLYFYKNNLIAIQNGVNPQRVIKIFLNDDFKKVKSYKIIEASNPEFNEITLGVISGNDFYYIANSQWGNFKLHGEQKPDAKFDDVKILKTKLD